MKLFLSILAVSVLLSLHGLSQTKPDIIIFDEGDNAAYHDASVGFITAPSTLALGGGSGDKLIVDASQHYSGSKSGKLEWRSASGGSWNIFVASAGWPALNAVGYDSLVFFVNSRTAIPAAQLPTIGLETSTNKLSPLITPGTYLPGGTDADTTTWQRVSIPMSLFAGIDLSIIKDVNFHQNTADNILHTMWFDNVRIIVKGSTPDTTRPSAPQQPVILAGDKSIVLHWNLNTDAGTTGYRIYKATSASGPFTAASQSVALIASFADCTVSNGPTYFYYVKGVNASLTEGPASDTVSASPKAFASDDAFLDYVEHTAFDYFWYEANPKNGLIKDRSTQNSSCSIAAVGFGLTAIGVGIDRGWITRAEGRDRTLVTLNTFLNGAQSVLTTNVIGYKGWFYHFLDMKTAVRSGSTELSSIDTGLLLAGMIYSKQYFSGSDSIETKIRTAADSIYRRVDWNWMCNGGTSLTMGWDPSSKFINARWIGYNEASILYILGLGAPVNPLSVLSWTAWTSGYNWSFNRWLNNYLVDFAPLFGHQYSQCWIDNRTNADEYMKLKGITYFENSRRATLAQRLYCIDNPRGATGYGPNMWGITASDVPTGYSARGTNNNDDGTLNATAPGGSLPFAPEVCMPALRNMYDTYRTTIWTGYGFCDAFNLSVSPAWWDTDVLGIDQGPIIIMAENYRTGNVWKTFMKEPAIATGLQRAGFTTVTGVAGGTAGIPSTFALQQNYPNPFNPSTEIGYSIPSAGHVALTVYNVLGERVVVLVDAVQQAGMHTVAFDASHVASGIYFYTLRNGESVTTRKMTLLH
jgi:hypothetical protein